MKRLVPLLILALFLVACSGPAPAADPPPVVDAEPTAGAEPTALSEPLAPTALPTEPVEPTAGSEPAATTGPAEPQATATEVAGQPEAATPAAGMNGRNDDGTFYRGSPDAPVTLVEYSDFLWTTCRAHVLGAGKQIVDTYVAGGQVQIVFWPITDLGQTSVDAAASAYCVGRQDVDAYWRLHDLLFEQFQETHRGGRDYFANTAVAAGADQAAFAACYDSGEGHAVVTNLDQIRLDMGINRRPTFDLNGALLFGAPPFATFDQVIQAALPW